MGLHVDDYVGALDGVHSENDLQSKLHDGTAGKQFQDLAARFKFGKIDFADEQLFCGVVQKAVSLNELRLNMSEYIRQIKPISLEKQRRQQSNEKVNHSELTRMQGLAGSMQWPAAQCFPALAASVSLQAATAESTIQDIVELNKTLRFAKENCDLQLLFIKTGPLEQLRFGSYCDGSLATRRNGGSQIGRAIFVFNEVAWNRGDEVPLVLVDYASQKAARKVVSSLAVEAQAACAAVDQLEWCKALMALIMNPDLDPKADETLHLMGRSPVLTDAKALYDASRSQTSGLGISNRRTALEVTCLNERMRASLAYWSWVNGIQQFADGLTKTKSRQFFADVLRTLKHRYQYDPDFVAAKKTNKKQQ